ncbi:MAG: ABC transporter permease [Lachnospiraceae bacterium]|nr:ABC transporter permease [Lachnospiraceae bacterium]
MLKKVLKCKKIISVIISLLIIFAGNSMRDKLADSLSTEYPELRWSADGTSCGYVAAYYPVNEGVTQADVHGYRETLKKILTESSIEEKDNARVFLDSYSTFGTANISGTRNTSTTTVNVTAIGGDYFFIHPDELLTGGYISENDLMPDRVVIDEQTAWSLYGSTDVTGKYLMIGTEPYYIAGVIRPHDSEASVKTYGNRSRIYMLFDAYKKINETAAITCYEIVYPDMITNYAYNKLNETLGVMNDNPVLEEEESTADNPNIHVINMSTRFKVSSLWKVITSYGERSSQTDGIIYPNWENEYRRTEDFAAVILLTEFIAWTVVFILSVIGGFTCYKRYKPMVTEKIKKLKSIFD